LQLDAVQAGKVGDKRMISHSGEFKCFKNFFLYMKNGDTVVIRNLYSGFRECIICCTKHLHKRRSKREKKGEENENKSR
jgi:hypothetical protein